MRSRCTSLVSAPSPIRSVNRQSRPDSPPERLSVTIPNDTSNTVLHNDSRSQSERRKWPLSPLQLRSINALGTSQILITTAAFEPEMR